jgi:hypothetical protein
MKTTTYKMVVILGTYRRAKCMTGAEFAEDVRLRRAKSGEHFDYIFDKDFIILAEGGFTQLKREEALLYAHYIAQALRYPEEAFIKVLEFEAEWFNGDVFDAISAITIHMHNLKG